MLERVVPAVVNISTTQQVQVQRMPLFDDPFFRRFFGDPGQLPPQNRRSLGSGVIVDAGEGYILTNHHVVNGADEINVTLHDGSSLAAKILGSDPEVDLAIIEVDPDAQNLHGIQIGNSEELRVGDYVVAIGNPFGLGQTVTSGIVSALGRTGLGLEGYEDFIQTDASINPGNSGGALVDLRGNLVGVNTAIVGPSGGNVGIGFAIPMNMAREVMDQLIEFGEVKRGQLGIYIQDLSPDLARAMDLDIVEGVLVTQVIQGSPADRAGIGNGDVVLAVDGRPVKTGAELRNRIGLMRVGTKVELTVVQDGKEKTIRATIEGRELQGASASAEVDDRLRGADFGPIQPSHPLADEIQGIEVLRVEPGSLAARNGLQRGDVITEVNRRPVRDLEEMRAALGDADHTLLLHVRRGAGALYLAIE
jgi:serine protease Do/serine protease DegQ